MGQSKAKLAKRELPKVVELILLMRSTNLLFIQSIQCFYRMIVILS